MGSHVGVAHSCSGFTQDSGYAVTVGCVETGEAFDHESLGLAVDEVMYERGHALASDYRLRATPDVEERANALLLRNCVENPAASPIRLCREVPAALAGHAESTGELSDLVDPVRGHQDGAQHVAAADGLVDEGVERHIAGSYE